MKKETLEAMKNFKPTEKQLLNIRLLSLKSSLKRLNEEAEKWQRWSTENQKRHKDDREYGTTDVYYRIDNVKKNISELEIKISTL